LNLGLSLYAAGRKEEAAKHWRTVLEISPGNRNAEMYLELAKTT
ncbi:MAG TPA: tetratricopeptide repeat protein, partial [Anaeromyxobacter sp.]